MDLLDDKLTVAKRVCGDVSSQLSQLHCPSRTATDTKSRTKVSDTVCDTVLSGQCQTFGTLRCFQGSTMDWQTFRNLGTIVFEYLSTTSVWSRSSSVSTVITLRAGGSGFESR